MNAGPEPWLNVIGIGDAGLASLSATARAIVETGEVLVGGDRHLAMVPEHAGERLRWGCPLEATLDDLEALRGRRVVVLASGDPMCFGVGELLVRRFAPGETARAAGAFGVQPGVRAARLASGGGRVPQRAQPAARAACAAILRPAPGWSCSAVTARRRTPSPACSPKRASARAGCGVFEHLDGPAERTVEGTAGGWPATRFAPLNTIAIECIADPGAAIRSRTPGLPDDAFESDGMLTKREVRAATLARLMPFAAQRLWDVGAGSGAIAIEWLRAAEGAAAIAVEQDAARCAIVARNAERLGTPELTVVHARAPDCLAGLPAPDAVFVGGGIGEPAMLETCWQMLRPGGRLVANVVTAEGEQRLLAWQAANGGELLRIEVARLDALGSYRAWRPSLPVTQLAARKP